MIDEAIEQDGCNENNNTGDSHLVEAAHSGIDYITNNRTTAKNVPSIAETATAASKVMALAFCLIQEICSLSPLKAPRFPMPDQITPESIAGIEQLIRPHIRHTPVLRVDMTDFSLVARPVDLKLECLQHSGSFKARGAFTNLLTRSVPPAGVVAASGGNHGAAVAYAAMRLGVPASIFVPGVTSPAKAERIRGYGARLVIGGDRYADALAASERFAEESGALAIHAFDQPETLLGQGTLGAEIEADLPEITTLLVAVGGGGLIGGIAAWFRGKVKIVAVEPEGAPTLHRAL